MVESVGLAMYDEAYSVPGRITKAYNEDWPNTLGHVNDVTVQFVAGYTSPDQIPQTIRQAIMMIVGELYKNREEPDIKGFPEGVNQLLGPYRVVTL